ncbi:LacI family DNA-binding transcriptional regulator [Schumannella luteola]|uniref:LacI family transcriptional regulator n=1 Tax=Schumannella luteola TaxID=472059 RepID=A0A852YJZ9_9MICO|nr:LacI family DNA-binding transcriptional regulator [Schumannella luteola]NYG97525.1 LacI family transcriptional regulator [Schumannella luteola]TPX01545.1 LacI family transcriptional regulator [Schumannella luteola]
MTVSVKEVAQHAGVSVGTVSNVLNHPERVSEAARRKVTDAIRDLGFVRNDAARQLRAGRSTTLGLVVLDVRNPFFTDVALGAEDAAAAAGLSVLLGNSDENPERESTYLDLFEEQRVFGVLISPVGDVGPRLQRLRERGTPAVLVDRVSADETTSSVSVDDVEGGRVAVEHLIAQGRRRIAYVGGPFAIRQVTDRLEGAQRAIDASPDAALEVLTTHGLTVLEGRRIGEQLAARPAGRRPDAVFAANDLLAMGLLQALVMQGRVRVPDDVALIGFDDIDFTTAAVVPISSVRQPSRLIGETAVKLLLAEGEDPAVDRQRIEFTPELVARASTGAAADD